jgi:hypothetical protein
MEALLYRMTVVSLYLGLGGIPPRRDSKDSPSCFGVSVPRLSLPHPRLGSALAKTRRHLDTRRGHRLGITWPALTTSSPGTRFTSALVAAFQCFTRSFVGVEATYDLQLVRYKTPVLHRKKYMH